GGEKDEEMRFQSATDMAFVLSEAVSGAAAAATSGPRIAESPVSKKRGTAVAAAIALALLVVGGVFLLRRFHRASTESTNVKRLAVLPFENLGTAEDDYFADGIADEVRGKLTLIPALQVITPRRPPPHTH